MSMLAGQVDYVIGVDTHRDTNTAAVVEAATGAVVQHRECATDALGYQRLYAFVEQHAPRRRAWAIEGTGSFGAGLTALLRDHGEQVVEIDRPKRPARRNGAKSDHWTPLERRARRCRVSILPSRARAAGAKPYECC